MKLCSSCNETKPLMEFYPDKKTSLGVSCWCKECQKKRNNARYHTQPKKAYLHKYQGKEKALVGILYAARNRAHKRGLAFDIDLHQILLPEYCPVLGIKIDYNGRKGVKADDSPSMDRTDPNKGYITDNVVIMSWRANRLKNNGNLEDFKLLVKYMETQK